MHHLTYRGDRTAWDGQPWQHPLSGVPFRVTEAVYDPETDRTRLTLERHLLPTADER